MDTLLRLAKRIPANVRRHVLDEGFIDKARSESDVTNTPMHFIFEQYELYLDSNGEFDNWYCPKCREHVLKTWRKVKPYLQQLEMETANGNR